MHILVTGGAGFIGSNFIRYWLRKYPKSHVVNLDLLTYAGNLENLLDIASSPNYTFVQGDIANTTLVIELLKKNSISTVVNFAAESHNGRAMTEPDIFVKTNVLGTQGLLEACRLAGNIRLHHVSTCEVFGDLELDEQRAFKETDPYLPKTPYNASKAGANHIAMAYFHTFKLPVTISHCSNNYGPFQYPEKLIPRFITNLLLEKDIPLFKSSANKREWLYVLDHCEAIDLILHKGRIGEAYNIGSGIEQSVEEIADFILDFTHKPKSLKTYVEDRPGHDKRYLLDTTKIKAELGWEARTEFEIGMKETLEWYVSNRSIWEKLLDKGYTEEYSRVESHNS